MTDPTNQDHPGSNETTNEVAPEAEAAGPPERKVAPTLLDTSTHDDHEKKEGGGFLSDLTATYFKLAKAYKKPKRTVAPTLLEDVSDDGKKSGRQLPFQSHESGKIIGPGRKGEVFVAKTMLDYETIQNTLSGALEKSAAISAEQAEREPGLPDIQGFKPATACPSKAVCTGPQKINYCGTCKSEMYNLDGMDADQARSLIFTRENRENFPLFRRHDGLYMTRDCPMAAKVAQKRLLLLIVLAFVVAGTIGLICFMPHLPQSAHVVEETAVPAVTVTDSSTEKPVDTAETPKSEVVAPDQLHETKSKGQYYYELPAPSPTAPQSTTVPVPQNEAPSKMDERQQINY